MPEDTISKGSEEIDKPESRTQELEQTIERLKQRNLDLEQRILETGQVESTGSNFAQVQKALQNISGEEGMLNVITKNMSDIVSLCDLKGTYLFVSPTAENILGYKPIELIGKSSYSLVYKDEKEYILRNTKKNLSEDNTTAKYEYRIKHADGHFLWVETITNLIRDEKNIPRLAILTTRDITERKQAVEALSESEEKYRTLFENAPFSICLIGKDNKYNYVNPKFKELFGYDLTDVPDGRAWFKNAYPDERYRKDVIDTWFRDIKDTRQGECQPRDFRVRCKDGTEKYVNIISSKLYSGEFLIAYSDITEQKKAEEEKKEYLNKLFQAQKLESMGILAGGIAHNFNNILMAILGHKSLMDMSKRSLSDHEHLDGIEELIVRATSLTRDILGFAQGGKYHPMPIDLNNIIKDVNKMFGKTKKEIVFYEELEDKLMIVNADQSQIEQSLLNLYVNAAQAMPNGGRIYTRTKPVTLEERFTAPFELPPGKYIKISITDTGIGMDEKTLEKIFDPFFTTKSKGSGLGLASVYGIIKNHKGIINVYSEIGNGTTFNIFLPESKEEKAKEDTDNNHGELMHGRGNVLLVDDEDAVRNVGQDLLTYLGYSVHTAANGQEALKIYNRHKDSKDKIDLVILDMIMPEMGGGKVYEMLKDADENVQILLSSGYSMNEQIKEMMEKGCGFIQKPFSLSELSSAVYEKINENKTPNQDYR
ncbi:PAS domain S-box protein [Candidatus Woesearchaeota archaeon]|nr:PAS domain S-box protein [Candidatus Woesearchaeota archaeon]